MKRAIGLGLGVAWAAVSSAAEPGPVSVYAPAVPTATKTATLPSGISAAAAALPVAPTVPALYATKAPPVPTQYVAKPAPAPAVSKPTPTPAETEQVQAIVPAPAPYGVVDGSAPVVVDAGCSTCGEAVEGGHGHRSFGGRIANWLMFRPGPAVLPRFVPTPYQAPLMSYFPNGPVPLPVAPGPVQYAPPVEQEPAPAVAVPTPRETTPAPVPVTPPPPPLPPSPKRLLKNNKAGKPQDAEAAALPANVRRTIAEVRYMTRGATPEAPEVLLVGAQTQAEAPAPAPAPKPSAAPSDLPAPAAVVTPAPVPEPVVPVASAYAPFDSTLLVSQARVFKQCEHHAGHIPCTGHGNLYGFRFAMPVVSPCHPPGPLMVKDCSASGGCANGTCGATGAVAEPAVLIPASATAPAKPSGTDVTRAFTKP